ncbi:MAG: TylF/MycF family methyltransferase [Treponema sp.]|jgi:O-methyltransferase|nr:TylF/MycF family methyltransferase [Treponema sp.]
MKTVVILGAGQMGQAACKLLNPNSIEVVAFGDNNPDTWNYTGDIQVLPVPEALRANPDLVLIGVLDEERGAQLKAQAHESGYSGEIMTLGGLYHSFDIRSATFKHLAERIRETNVEGALAELGVYRGDFAWQLNEQFPDRKLYLFDTFEGLHEQDIKAERQIGASKARVHDFSDTKEKDVLTRMPYEKQIVLKKGYFPEIAQGIEERFAIVSIDVDLYAPTLAGLAYFYPRLNPGGVIILHDYNSRQFDGVQKAVQKYESEHGRLPIVPLSDLHGSAVIIRT